MRIFNFRRRLIESKNNFLKNKFKSHFKLSRFLFEGGASGHMDHPYEDLDLTFGEIREIIEDASSGMKDESGVSKVMEKVDGQNMWFTVDISKGAINPELDIYFSQKIRTLAEPSNLSDFRHQWSGHPAEDTYILGCEAIAETIAAMPFNVLQNVFGTNRSPQIMQNDKNVFAHKGTYIECEILFPENPIQFEYDQPGIAFHSVAEVYIDDKGRVQDNEYGKRRNGTKPKYELFVNSFEQNEVNISNDSITRGLNPEYFPTKQYQFKLTASDKNRLNVNKLSDSDKNELLRMLSNIQTKAGASDDMTLGQLKNTYIKDVLKDQINIIKDELLEKFSNIEAGVGLDEVRAIKIANYIVKGLVLKSDEIVDGTEYRYSDMGASQIKSIFDAKNKKNPAEKIILDAINATKIFNKTENMYVARVAPSIKNAITEGFMEVQELFFMLGVKILEGIGSNLISQQNAETQSKKFAQDISNALADYYDMRDDDPRKAQHRKNIFKIERLIQYQNQKMGVNVDVNNPEDIVDKAKNLQIDAVEGVVYNFKDKMFKFTGTYAPLNQILGFTLAKTYPSRFPRLWSSKINWQQEEGADTIAIIPGAFKPPHLGHKKMIQHYIGLGAKQILVVVSNPSGEESLRKVGERNISAPASCILWRKLCADLMSNVKIDFIVTPISDPITMSAIFVMNGSQNIKPGTTVYLGCSQKADGTITSQDATAIVDETSEQSSELAPASPTSKADSSRFNDILSYAKVRSDLNVPNPEEFASPATTISPRYLEIVKSQGIYEQLPSVMDGKNPLEYHASDLRFLLNFVRSNPSCKQCLVFYLGSINIVNDYIDFIYGSDMKNSLSANDSQLFEEGLIKRFIKLFMG